MQFGTGSTTELTQKREGQSTKMPYVRPYIYTNKHSRFFHFYPCKCLARQLYLKSQLNTTESYGTPFWTKFIIADGMINCRTVDRVVDCRKVDRVVDCRTVERVIDGRTVDRLIDGRTDTYRGNTIENRGCLFIYLFVYMYGRT